MSGCHNNTSSLGADQVAGQPQEYDQYHLYVQIMLGDMIVTQCRMMSSYSVPSMVTMTLVYSIITVCGVLGNIVTCTVIARNKTLYTATNYYLFNMAVSDLLLLAMGIPHEMQVLWSPLHYILGEVFCISRGLAAETSTNASVLTIAAFTVERYIGICHPIRSQTMAQPNRALKVIVAVWVVACLGAVPQAIQYGIDKDECKIVNAINYSFEVSTFLFFITPMTLITVVYVKIGLELHQARPPGVNVQTCRSVAGADRNRNKGVIKMLVAVVVAFFVCFAPHHAQRLLAFYGDPTNSVQVTVYKFLTNISGVFFYLSTCVNPILYHLMSNRFRRAFKDTVGQCLGVVDPSMRRMASVGQLPSNDLSIRSLRAHLRQPSERVKGDAIFSKEGAFAPNGRTPSKLGALPANIILTRLSFNLETSHSMNGGVKLNRTTQNEELGARSPIEPGVEFIVNACPGMTAKQIDNVSGKKTASPGECEDMCIEIETSADTDEAFPSNTPSCSAGNSNVTENSEEENQVLRLVSTNVPGALEMPLTPSCPSNTAGTLSSTDKQCFERDSTRDGRMESQICTQSNLLIVDDNLVRSLEEPCTCLESFVSVQKSNQTLDFDVADSSLELIADDIVEK